MATKITTQTIETMLTEAKALVATGAQFVTLNPDGTVEPTDPQTLATSFFPEPEGPAPSAGPMTRDALLACFQPLPATVTAKRHRLEFLLDDIILASKDDPTTNAAAWYLRGRIWTLVSTRRQSLKHLHEQVADSVLARREIEQAAAVECAMLASAVLTPAEQAIIDAIGRILAQQPEPPEPTSPASAPVPQVYGDEEDFEAFCLQGDFWREYDVALPHILNHWDAFCANWADEDWDGWDEWEAHQRERAYRAAKVVAA